MSCGASVHSLLRDGGLRHEHEHEHRELLNLEHERVALALAVADTEDSECAIVSRSHIHSHAGIYDIRIHNTYIFLLLCESFLKLKETNYQKRISSGASEMQGY